VHRGQQRKARGNRHVHIAIHWPRRPVFGVRQILIGMVAAGFTFAVGKLLGVSMS
jgi:hypothetical protein